MRLPMSQRRTTSRLTIPPVWKTCGLLLIVVVVGGIAAVPSAAEEPDAKTREGWRQLSELGSGFVIWESSRTGHWRIWRRELDGSGLRQIGPDEGDREHYCPHLSPDGSRLVYLSFPAGSDTYDHMPRDGVRMMLMQSDGSGLRQLADGARAYFEDRGAVWIDDNRLIYIDGQGFTREMNVENGKSVKLTDSGVDRGGYLINAPKTHATTGEPTFSLYEKAHSKIIGQNKFGGCQPYFTHDGRWGFWMGGAGGPINRINLQTRQVSPILEGNDPRMPKNRNYLYFPMVSRDSRLFACAASPGQHDHFTSDYDVFVARLNPQTLEIVGEPVRYSFHPKNDRFPDVFLADLDLGQPFGEAPLTVDLKAKGKPGNWHWDFGDGGKADGASGRHTYEKPGRYQVRAVQGKTEHRGLVTVAPAAPPKLEGAFLRSDNELVVLFNEPIDAAKVNAKLDSGTPISKTTVADGGKSLLVHLAKKLSRTDTLHLSGVTDRAQRPNALAPQMLKVEPLAWPTNRDGLVFVFETADKPNQVPGPNGEPARSYPLEPRGRARLSHDHALVLTGGAYLVEGADSALLDACKKTNQLTVETVLQPDHLNQTGPARIVTYSSNAGSRNFTLGQERDKLIFRLRTPNAGGNGVNPESTLCSISAGSPLHVAVTYRPGELIAYVDGKEVYRGKNVQGDFSNWEPQHLLLGDEFDGQRDWSGTLEGVAIYNRVLHSSEIQRNAGQYHSLLRSRKQAPQIDVKAKLVAKSPAPTLDEIKPYRSALMVCKYRVEQAIRGKLADKEIFVAQWALLDGQQQPVTGLKPGAEVRLTIESYEDNRQLQRFVVKDDFDGDNDLLAPRYYDATP